MSFVHAAQRARGAAYSARARVLTTEAHRALFGSAFIIAVLTLGAKFVTLGRDMVMASRFGTSDANDAMIASWSIPGFLLAIVSSAFVGAIIPVLIETRLKHDRRREQAMIGEVMILSTVAFAAITLVLFVGNHTFLPLIAPGYSSSKLALATHLAVIFLPAVFISGVACLWIAILNAENRFGLASSSAVLVPATGILILVLFPRAGIEWFVASIVIGNGLQAALLYLGLQRTGISVALSWHG